MTDKCSPLHLPIVIEPTCRSSASCNSCTKEYTESKCSTIPPINNQGFYLGKCSTKITQIPVLNLAYLSNTMSDCEPDVILNLNPICLTWCDFLVLFFSSNGAFSINPTNSSACAVAFTNQTYESTQNKCIKLNLADQIRKTWTNKNNKLVSNLPIKTNLILNKETFYIRSLISSVTSIGLGLDQAISTLLNNNEIAPADHNSCATVKFVVSYKYYFEPLDTSVLIDFEYVTKIPCYKNINECDTFCPPYSKDSNCRTCLDTDGEETVTSFLNHNDFKSVDMSNMSNMGNMSKFETDSNSDDESCASGSISNERSVTEHSVTEQSVTESLLGSITVASSKW